MVYTTSMNQQQIIQSRLANQHLSDNPLSDPAEVVRQLGAVQSQDHGGAKWALALRLSGITEAQLNQAFDDGLFLRTHVLRPTWHYVLPEDIVWMLKLTAPRIQTSLGSYYRKLNLDETFLRRTAELLTAELQGGKHYTRAEIRACFERHTIKLTDPLDFGFIMGWAELEGYICNGAMRGKQQTYALLSERAPHARELTHDEAVAELTRRFFTSHGPATTKDFAWWSSLTAADIRLGIELNKEHLASKEVDGQAYWFAPGDDTPMPASPTALLLPNYDEYTVAYKERAAYFDPAYLPLLDSRANPIFQHTLLIDGKVRGTWRRNVTKSKVAVEVKPFDPLPPAEQKAVQYAVETYGSFVGLPAELTLV